MEAVMERERVEEAAADAAALKRALDHGGRAILSVRSKKTGKHVQIRLTAKKKKGRGYVSRAKTAGRVGIRDADVIFADDPTLDFSESNVGSFDLGTGEWKTAKEADPARAWAGQYLIAWALTGYDLERFAEVFISLRCCYCGHALRDPVSVERGIGPECFGRHTASRSAARS